MVCAWDSIPEIEKNNYREVVAVCQDNRGNIVGGLFPANINSIKNSRKAYRLAKNGERFGLSDTNILKNNLFPEPEGVEVVKEEIVWGKLERYKGYFINVSVRKYDVENPDSYTNRKNKKKTPQFFVDVLWNESYIINNWNEYRWGIKTYIMKVALYCTAYNILKKTSSLPSYEWTKRGLRGIGKIVSGLIWGPSIIVAQYYVKKRGITINEQANE